jgi:hypothetical protein
MKSLKEWQNYKLYEGYNTIAGKYIFVHPYGSDFDIIASSSSPDRWNTDAVALATCKSKHIATLIADFLTTQNLKDV